MKLGNRIISLLLVVALLVSSVPLAARAENAPKTTAGTGDISFEGTNGFGTLLSDEIAKYQSEMDAQGGYTVTGLEITGNQATVTYDSMEEAQLVVALYTEDGVQLLTSATAIVSPEETEVVVEFAGEMPQYFMASAYLLDSYDYSPLCASYDTPMYTREMQELLASTVDDYDPDRVLNLDDDKTNNFAVYSEDTAIIDYVPGVNTLKSADHASRTYIIENVDEQITGLQSGDVLAYPYAEGELLILKVGSIQVSGTTATITGTDLEMEEVFSHVKLETAPDVENMVVTDLDPNDGIEYLGTNSGKQRAGWNGSAPIEYSRIFGVNIRSDNERAEFQGGLSVSLDGGIEWYVSGERRFLEFKLIAEFGLSVRLAGTMLEKEWPIKGFARLSIPTPIAGVKMACEPTFKGSFSGEAQGEITISTTIGFSYETDKGFRNLSTSPRLKAKLDAEVELFVGIDLKPKAVVVGLIEFKLLIPIGVTINAALTGTDFDPTWIGSANEGPSIHGCKKCLDISGSIGVSIGIELDIFPIYRRNKTFTINPVEFPAYWSFTHNDFGYGKCPYENYRVIVEVKDSEGRGVPGAVVKASPLDKEAGETSGTTNFRGTLVFYLQSGDYAFHTDIGEETCYVEHTVSDACKITLALPVEKGQCGENVYWYLYPDGQLLITGTGPMYVDYSFYEAVGDVIKEAILEEGATTIARNAFQSCTKLTSITIPDSVTSIGMYAFLGCRNLMDINIPNSVTSIGYAAFLDCNSLRSVTIPDSVTSVGQQTFQSCSNLRSVSIGSGITTIPFGMFQECSRLITANIPNGVTRIEANAFSFTRLVGITIPDSVTYIGTHAFWSCSNLASVVIGDGVTTIDGWVFASCSSLVSVVIGASVTSIGDGAFAGCSNLRNVVFRGPLPAYIGEGNDDLFGGSDGEDPTSADLINTAPSGDIRRPDRPVYGMNPNASFDGEYSSEVTDDYTIQTASFTGLVPGAQYVLLALADKEIPNPLDAENLLFIDQAAAGEDGTLTFRYAQRVSTDVSYVIACGPSNKNLADAEITFPVMTADGTLQVVNPTVTYDGKILTEGVDYVLTGTVDFTRPGTYTCFIRGIHDYNGMVECQYTVKEPQATRLAGSHRWNTAIKVADEMKANLKIEKFDAIIIASGNDFADALAGSYLSTVKNAPILLAWGQGGAFEFLDDDNIAYIKANLAEDGVVYILGGEKAVPGLYEEALKDFTVKRLGGADRFETNLLILEEAGVKDGDEILVCTATNFADSLSASATGKPILLVFNNLTELLGKQPEFLAGLKDCTFAVIGGENAVSAKLAEAIGEYGKVERLAGENRFETSVMVAEKYFENPETAVLAYAWNYPDGLCGGSLAYSLKAPLILTMTGYESAAVEYAKTTGITSGLVLGGDALISDASVRAIFAMDAADEIVVK